MPYAEVSAYDVLWSDACWSRRAHRATTLRRCRSEPRHEPPRRAKAVKSRGARRPWRRRRRRAPRSRPRPRPAKKTAKKPPPRSRPRSRRRRRRGSERCRPAQYHRAPARDREEFHRVPGRGRRTRSRCTRDANKHQIRQAIEKLFDVNVTDVRTMQMRAARGTRRPRRRHRRRAGRRPIVTLRDGETSPIFEG